MMPTNDNEVAPKNFPRVLRAKILGLLPYELQFSLLYLDKEIYLDEEIFVEITNNILNQRKRQAYPYQAKVLKRLFQLQNKVLQKKLLENTFGSTTLIKKIEKSTDEDLIGEAWLYGRLLSLEYLGSNLTINPKVSALLAQINILHYFSKFLTLQESKSNLDLLLKKEGKISLIIDSEGNDKFLLQDEKAIIASLKNIDDSDSQKQYLFKIKRQWRPENYFLFLTMFIPSCTDPLVLNEVFKEIVENVSSNQNLRQNIRLTEATHLFNALILFLKKSNTQDYKKEIFDVMVKALSDQADLFKELEGVRQKGIEKLIEIVLEGFVVYFEKYKVTEEEVAQVLESSTAYLTRDFSRNVNMAFLKTLMALSKKITVEMCESMEALYGSTEKENVKKTKTLAVLLTAFSETLPQKNKMLDFFEKFLKKEDPAVSRQAAFEILSAFMDMPAAQDKGPEILNCIIGDRAGAVGSSYFEKVKVGLKFMQNIVWPDDPKYNESLKEAQLNALSLFIDKFAMPDQAVKILDFIKENLRSEKESLKEAALFALFYFVDKFASQYQVEEILALFSEMLGGNMSQGSLRKAAFSVLSKMHKFANQEDERENVFLLLIRKLNQYRSFDQAAALTALSEMIKGFAAQWGVTKVLNFLTNQSLCKDMKWFSLRALINICALEELMKTSASGNENNKEIFNFIIKNILDLFGNREGVDALSQFISKLATQDQANKIFDLVKEHLSRNEVKNGALFSILAGFIEKFATQDQANEIFDLIKKDLSSNEVKNSALFSILAVFIQKFAIPDQSENIFCFITESLGQLSFEKEMRWRALLEFVDKFSMTQEQAVKIFNLIKKEINTIQDSLCRPALEILAIGLEKGMFLTANTSKETLKDDVERMLVKLNTFDEKYQDMMLKIFIAFVKGFSLIEKEEKREEEVVVEKKKVYTFLNQETFPFFRSLRQPLSIADEGVVSPMLVRSEYKH